MRMTHNLGRLHTKIQVEGCMLSSMLILFTLLAIIASVAGVVAAPSESQKLVERQRTGNLGVTEQIPLGKPKTSRRKLHGRFLHITDIHPDPYYTPNAPPSNACHVPTNARSDISPNKKGKSDDDDDDDQTRLAGKYGAPTTSCDTPQSLVNATFNWIKKELMRDDLEDGEGIDFVIWTGDSARHDNDVHRPRTWKEILDLNTMVVEKMQEVFGDPDGLKDSNPYNDYKIPIIPTLGNNDIMPHNIFLPGPSKMTREYLHLWRSFIPEDQYHIFERGAYFWKEVIPGNQKLDSKTSPITITPPGKLHHGGLAVISLNSMYFFSSNSAVDGCDLKTEPGYEQFEWLRHQLQLMRDTGMKAIIIGHVPPARVREVGWREGGKDDWEVGWKKRSWDETCWRKWVAWNQQYRDVIAGSVFGHMNLDHFMLLDTEELKREHRPRRRKGKGGKGKGKGKNATFVGIGEMDGDHLREGSTYSSLDDFGTAGNSIYKPGFTPYRSHPTIMMTEDDPYCLAGEEPDQVISITSAEDYLQSLRESLKRLVLKTSKDDSTPYKEKIGGKYAERFVVNIVSPSVVPNYFPTLRIVEYNISGLVDDEGYLFTPNGKEAELAEKQGLGRKLDSQAAKALLSQRRPSPEEVDAEISKIPELVEKYKIKQKKNKDRKPTKPEEPIPDPPPNDALPGPAYMNQPFTFLGYIQYFANLTRINHAANKKTSNTPADGLEDGEFYYQVEYDTRTDEAYKLKDMTVKSFLKLSRRLVDASGGLYNPKKGNGKDGENEKGTDEDLDDKEEGDNSTFHPDSDIEPDKKKKKKKIKVPRKGGNKKRDWIWREFLSRAFVGTIGKKDLDDLVGYEG